MEVKALGVTSARHHIDSLDHSTSDSGQLSQSREFQINQRDFKSSNARLQSRVLSQRDETLDMRYERNGHQSRISDTRSSSDYAVLRRGSSTHRRHSDIPTARTGEIKTTNLVKSASGFRFTLADTPTGQMVKTISEPLGCGQLRPGDVIVSIDGVDVSRETHERVVSILKAYSPGSNARISFVRPSGNKHRQHPHSGSSLFQPPSVNEPQDLTRDNCFPAKRVLPLRPETLTFPNGNAKTLDPTNDVKTSSTPEPLPRASSLSYSTNATLLTKKMADPAHKSKKGHQYPSNHITDMLKRSVTSRKSTPVYELQKQYWTTLTSMSSNLNFSGTPDFIPASVYCQSSGTDDRGSNSLTITETTSPSTVNPTVERPRYSDDRNSDHGFVGDASVATVTKHSQTTRHRNPRLNSLYEESNRSKTRKLFQADGSNKMQQLTIGSLDRRTPGRYSEHPYSNHSNRLENGRNSAIGGINRSSHYPETRMGSLLQPDALESVYNVDIHRGSRGFGFSIRGGKEFGGMPLLVLDIAEGGPADSDGRMKNGDQILSINGFSTKDMTHERAIELIQNATSPISLVMKRTTAPLLGSPKMQSN